MVQQQAITMGEDRTSTCAEKKSCEVVSLSRQRHSSVLSSCSEDAESESTSAGYPSTYDEEKEEELQYGPGIVSKLKTKYLSIALKQNRGTNMRRSCSMENLLDQDRSLKTNGVDVSYPVNGVGNVVKKNVPLGNLKRAKSMDTLLMDLQAEASSVKELVNGEDKREPKIIRRRDGGLNRTVPMISDEELPKPDTVKTYKRMFEPAESRRGSHCRRPPVLRASAKASALAASKNSNGILSSPCAKVNGVSMKNKLSAKPVNKAQSNVPQMNGVNGIVKKPIVKDLPKPLPNGCHLVIANPVKVVNSARKIKDIEKELNNINRLHKKEVHFSNKTEIICNGNSNHKEVQDQKVNCKEINGVVSFKPKVPPNKPSLRPPKPLPKLPLARNKKELSPINGLHKIPETENVVESIIKPQSKTKEEKPPTPPVAEEPKSPEVVKLTNGHINKEMNGDLPEKVTSPIREIVKFDKPMFTSTPEKKIVPLQDSAEIKKPCPVAPKTVDTPAKFEAKPMKFEAKPVKIEPKPVKVEAKPVKTEPKPVKVESKPVKTVAPVAPSTSMVFDFRGKDVVPHVAVLPVPFGCKGLNPKKRNILIDGKEVPNGDGVAIDEDDEDYVDYSVPPPSGVTFEGENIKIGRGSLLGTRNKDLKISFDDDIDNNTFIYPSESSLLEDSDLSPSNDIIPNDQPPPTPPKLKNNTVIGTTSGSSSGLSTYTPSVLRTMDNFEPGMFRPPPAPVLPEKEEDNRKEDEEENTDVQKEDEDPEMLKPADPDIISSWSLSAGTSDLLF